MKLVLDNKHTILQPTTPTSSYLTYDIYSLVRDQSYTSSSTSSSTGSMNLYSPVNCLGTMQWIGNNTSLSCPLSKVANDTFTCKVIPISSNECIVSLSSNSFYTNFLNISNYFQGLQGWFDFNTKSSSVQEYNNKTRVITFESNIFQYFFRIFPLKTWYPKTYLNLKLLFILSIVKFHSQLFC